MSPFTVHDENDADTISSGRGYGLRAPIAGFAAVAVLALGGAAAVGTHDAHASTQHGLTAKTAKATVRRFAEEAVVQDNSYAACQYLTTGEQAKVAALDGAGTCRAGLAQDPALFGLDTTAGVQRVQLHATVSGGTATVTARSGRMTETFTLTPTTGADTAEFLAPKAPWRIADGAIEMLTPAATSGAGV